MDEKRLSELLDGYFDRTLTEFEMAELEEILRSQPVARTRFWEATEWHALLRQWGEQQLGQDEAAKTPLPAELIAARGHHASPSRRPRVRWAWIARTSLALAASLTVAALGAQRWLEHRAPVAVIGPSVTARWTSPEPLTPGTLVRPGRLQLESGTAVVTLHRGARLTLEAPATLDIIDDNEAFLRTGSVLAHVPDGAHGFTLQTPQGVVVDLGTEFGCAVAPDQRTAEVHVFTGKVEFSAGANRDATRPLVENEAARLDSGLAEKIPARREQFAGDRELAARAAVALWRKLGGGLASHPSARVYFDFEESPASPGIFNRIGDPGTPAAVAVPIGVHAADGRRPGKAAIAFAGHSDRLAFQASGEAEALTLAAWVRVDRLNVRRFLYASTERETPGSVDWYVNADGGLGVGVRHPAIDPYPAAWRRVHGEPALQGPLVGRWVFLASVIDRASSSITHYLNGEPVGRESYPLSIPLHIGVGELGNVEQGPQQSGRPLEGRMDEFAIIAAPLSAADIRRLYEDGRPDRR